jgi:hypothetical protein
VDGVHDVGVLVVEEEEGMLNFGVLVGEEANVELGVGVDVDVFEQYPSDPQYAPGRQHSFLQQESSFEQEPPVQHCSVSGS